MVQAIGPQNQIPSRLQRESEVLVKCIENSVSRLSPEQQVLHRRFDTGDVVALDVGQLYLVFGITRRGSSTWYLVLEEPDADYPVPHHSGFFEVTDARIPPGWSISGRGNNAGEHSLLPSPWCARPDFMERLVDGDRAAMEEFTKITESLAAYHRGPDQ